MISSLFVKNKKQARKEIADLTNNNILNDFDITELRKKIEILFVDDENFRIIELLKKHRYNVTYKNDISDLNDALAYDIILCDIRGVGKEFDSPHEGAYLIKELKANYPRKVVIAYSGSTYDTTYTQYFNLADHVMLKDSTIDHWTNVLDSEIKKMVDPVVQWGKIRQELLDKGVSINVVSGLEDEYVSAIMSKNFDSFKNYGADRGDATKNVVNSVVKTLLVQLLVEGIINGSK